MAAEDQAVAAEASNRCDVVAVECDDTVEESSSPVNVIHMTGFLSRLTPAETLSQTLDYVRDPRAYLQSRLGSATFEERRKAGLLCLPAKIDRDVYGRGEHMAGFEQHIANLLGKQNGLFFLTGVQAQLAALKTWCERAGNGNRRVAWHVSSHLEAAEERAFEALYGLERVFLGRKEDDLPTVEEIREVLELPTGERPVVIVVEIPNRVLGCKTYTFSELETLSSHCRQAGVKLHCDGARLWEIEPYYRKTAGKTFADIAALFDSVYVSFYKGLRGATGAMLVHDDASFISEAKTWRRRAGGNAFTLFYEVVDCERGFNENIGTFDAKWAKMEEVVERVSAACEGFRTRSGERVVEFVPERALCCQVRTVFWGFTIGELGKARDRVEERLGVRVFEKMWPKKSLDEQGKEERTKKGGSEVSEPNVEDDDRWHVVEWMIVSSLLEVETKVLVGAYVALCEELVAASKD